MAYKVSNADFFKKPLTDHEEAKEAKEAPLNADKNVQKPEETPAVKRAEPFKLGKAVESVMTDSIKALKENGFSDLALEINKIRQSANRERFTIAVVGEFSRGKSTFLNKLLERDFLPVGDLPTTAVMTRIRYHAKEAMAVFNEKNEKLEERELSQNAWEDLVARNFGGEDFRGNVLVGIQSKWLDEGNIEMIDTPGAGDLNEERIKVVNDALLGCDGVIIAVNAIAALSMTEKIFIEERLLARKIPFMMLVVTKLDLIPLQERAGVVRYIRQKLASWKMDIPVYIPYQTELEDDSFDDVMGMDKIKLKISEWVTYPERVQTIETWALEKTASLLEYAISALQEKQRIAEESDQEKRKQIILDKRQKLAELLLVWGELHVQMQKKCTDCYDLLLSKIDEYSKSITERLQYEAGHANNPQKWWTEDFAYRSKIEFTNMAVSIENIVSRRIREDARWYSSAIEKTFQSYVAFQEKAISEKEMFENFSCTENISFGDLDKQRNVVRIASAVLSISGFTLFSAMGFLPIVATMGIGTGTSILSEKFFKKEIADQKDMIKKEIANYVPAFIEESLAESEDRLTSVYDNIIQEAKKSEQNWLNVQKAAIDNINIPGEGKYVTQIADSLSKLQKISSAIKEIR